MTNKPDEFNLFSVMNEIPAQFDKAIKEMAKTAEMLGHVIKDNLEEASSSPGTEPEAPADPTDSAIQPSSGHSTVPRSTLTPEDMVTLLDINDAVEELTDALEMIVGPVGVGSQGLIQELEKITSLIVNAAHPKTGVHEQEPQNTVDSPNEWIYRLLDDKTIDNQQKAQMLLGLI